MLHGLVFVAARAAPRQAFRAVDGKPEVRAEQRVVQMILEAGLNLTDVRKVHLVFAFPYISGHVSS